MISKTAFFFIIPVLFLGKEAESFTLGYFGQRVHQHITKTAAERAGLGKQYYKSMKQGVKWPDCPHGCQETLTHSCYQAVHSVLPICKESDTSIGCRSHSRDLQYWHSMVPRDRLSGKRLQCFDPPTKHEVPCTNRNVKKMIVYQIKEWILLSSCFFFKKEYIPYEKSFACTSFRNPVDISSCENRYSWFQPTDYDKQRAFFFLGKALHSVQDSFSTSHVTRNKHNEIENFQDYAHQCHRKHNEAEKEKTSKGVSDAIEASYKIISFYLSLLKIMEQENDHYKKTKTFPLLKNQSSFLQHFERAYLPLHDYIENKIFKIKPGHEHLSPGSVHPSFSK